MAPGSSSLVIEPSDMYELQSSLPVPKSPKICQVSEIFPFTVRYHGMLTKIARLPTTTIYIYIYNILLISFSICCISRDRHKPCLPQNKINIFSKSAQLPKQF